MNDFTSRERARRFHASYHSAPGKRSIETHGHQLEQFKNPVSVSADEEQNSGTNTAAPLLNKPPKRKNPLRALVDKLKSIPKKHWIIIGIITTVLLAGGGAAIWALAPRDETSKPDITVKEAPKPTTVASNLTGLQVKPNVNKRPVTAIMIENSPVARPQSGLLQAGVVFEAIAEGGITRFSALYQDEEPDYIGPVRSARKPWLQWILGFDAALAHVGGSAEALQLIRDWGVKDLDQFANSGAFWRIGSRAAPHNVYTSIERLREVEKQKGYGAAKYTSLERKAKEQPAEQTSAGAIDLNVSSANYNVHYDWDKSTNTYKRFIGGAPHTDDRSGNQLAPKVVVAPIMNQGKNDIYYTYDTIGEGDVYIFQDGKVIEGKWRKSGEHAQFTFVDNNGAPVKLNPGQTWFTVLGSADRVSYRP